MSRPESGGELKLLALYQADVRNHLTVDSATIGCSAVRQRGAVLGSYIRLFYFVTSYTEAKSKGKYL